VKRLSDKDVEKYTKRYETYVGSKTTESLIDNFIFLATKVVGMAINIKDIDAYQAYSGTLSRLKSRKVAQSRLKSP